MSTSQISTNLKQSLTSGAFVAPTSNNATGSASCDSDCQAMAWFVNMAQIKLGYFDGLTAVPSGVTGGKGGLKTPGGQPLNTANLNSTMPEA